MAEKETIKPIVPTNPPTKGMIVPKFGGLVKIGHGAVDADGKRTDLLLVV